MPAAQLVHVFELLQLPEACDVHGFAEAFCAVAKKANPNNENSAMKRSVLEVERRRNGVTGAAIRPDSGKRI